jgi:hypothetical protein
MPLLRKAILVPSQGLDYSAPSDLINERNGYPKNMRFYRNELCKREGRAKYGEVAISDAPVMGLGVHELSSGEKYLIRTSKKKTEKYIPASNTWESISVSDWSGGDDDFHSFAIVPESGLLIMSNYIDSIRKWTGVGNNTALAGDPPKAKFMTYVAPYLLLGYLNDGVAVNPWGVAWCDTGNPEVWSGGNSGSWNLSSDPSFIKNIARIDEFCVAYKENSIWLGRAVDTTDIFPFTCRRTGLGLSGSRAFADIGGIHICMGPNDFFTYNAVRDESIGGSVRDEVFSRINRDRLDRCFAIHVSYLREVWFFITIAGEDWPTEIWKYNYGNGFWYFDTCDHIICANKWKRTAVETWDDGVGTWDDDVGRWDDSISTENFEEIILGDLDGYTQKVDFTNTNDLGEAVEAWFISKDFTAETLEKLKRFQQLDVIAKGPGTLRVSYSTDYGDTWVFVSEAELTSQYAKHTFYFDVVCEHIRFKLVEASVSGSFFLRDIIPYYLSREEYRK